MGFFNKRESTGQCFEPTFRRTAGGRLSKSMASMAGIGALIFISGLLGVIPAVQHDTRLSVGREEYSSDEEEQSWSERRLETFRVTVGVWCLEGRAG